MEHFDHEKLDVYQASMRFIATVDDVVKQLPRGRAYLADQLQRAAASISLNIAEGAGEFSRKEKVRFYRMALRSATECAAIMDVCGGLDLVAQPHIQSGRSLLLRIVAMLTGLVKSRKETEAG